MRSPPYNAVTSRTEFDPLGANLSLTAPEEPPPGEGDGDVGAGHFGGIMDSRWSDFFNLSSGCMKAGVSASCSDAIVAVNGNGGSEPAAGPLSMIHIPGFGGPGPVPIDVAPAFADWLFRRKGILSPEADDIDLYALDKEFMPEFFSEMGFDGGEITTLVNEELAKADCIEFSEAILNALSKNGKGGSLLTVFQAFLHQPQAHPLFTRNPPPGSWGEASPTGKIKDSNAVIFSIRHEVSKTKNDANNVIGELFHLAGNGYTDKQLAKALHNTKYASEASQVMEPSANIFDPGYIPGGWTEENEFGYSTYFHSIQKLHCGLFPPSGRWK